MHARTRARTHTHTQGQKYSKVETCYIKFKNSKKNLSLSNSFYIWTYTDDPILLQCITKLKFLVCVCACLYQKQCDITVRTIQIYI